jgi:hypothetical protein
MAGSVRAALSEVTVTVIMEMTITRIAAVINSIGWNPTL